MSDFLFVHIPKSGGTSIRVVLEKAYQNSWLRNPSRLHHDTIAELKQHNNILPITKIFTVVRNPFTRAVSYYHHFMKHNNISITFKEFLLMINDGRATSRTPLIKYDQTHYLIDRNGELSVPYIFKYEQMNQVEDFLQLKLDFYNVGNYNKFNSLSVYNQETIDLVRHIYNRDFTNFNYSTDL